MTFEELLDRVVRECDFVAQARLLVRARVLGADAVIPDILNELREDVVDRVTLMLDGIPAWEDLPAEVQKAIDEAKTPRELAQTIWNELEKRKSTAPA